MTFAVLGQAGSSFFFPPQASEEAPFIDFLFDGILYLSIFFFVLIVAAMVYFVFKYRHREGWEGEESPAHNNAIELTWTIIPTILVVFIFLGGFIGYMRIRDVPPNTMDIRVKAKSWNWSFEYPDTDQQIIQANELYLPLDQDVRLIMSADKVIHSLFIPAFRAKMDVVPGKYSELWIKPTKVGTFDLFCTEYCGDGHSKMITKVIVVPAAQYRTFLREKGDILKDRTPEEAGEFLYKQRGCAQCHSIDGTRKVGPSFKGIWGETHEFSNASPTKVNEEYIRESIENPGAKIRAGYPNKMPAFDNLKPEYVDAIIAYIKSLKK